VLFSTAEVTVAPGAEFQTLPGLDTTVDVPANSFVYLSLNGGLRLPFGGVDDVQESFVVIYVDGNPLFAGGARDVRVVGISNIEYYSMATLVPLSVGTHTITVQARGLGGSRPAVIGGDTGTLTNAALSIMVLKQ
jgi:hypothetical protein